MNTGVLQDLVSDEFGVDAGFLGTPAGLHDYLRRSRQVSAIREALRQGALTEDSIRRFVASLMDDLHRGTRFPHELAISALAVSLESRQTDFAEDFLLDLARLETVEMSLSIRVARECLKHRFHLRRTKAREFRLGRTSSGRDFTLSGGRSTGTPATLSVRSASKLAIARSAHAQT
jgi:hypothetical protein